MAQQQSQLQNIFSKSFPANNLIEISLVKDNDPQLAFYKNRYFIFLSLTPGMKTDQGGRTFNKEGRITIKTEAEKLLALAHSMRAYARGQGQQVGQFAIFVDNSKSNFGNAGIKTCFVSEYNQEQQGGGVKRNIVLSFKTGQNKPVGNFWSPVEAIAVADIIEFVGKKCLELEFDHRMQTPMGTGGNNQGYQQNNTQNYQSPTPQNNQGGNQGYQQNPSQGGGNQNFNPNQGYQQNPQQNNTQNVTNAVQNAMMGGNNNPQQGGNQAPPFLDEDVPF
jgi:hypothetical protein